MKNPCGTTRANIIESSIVNGIPIYFGSGVNPVNSPAQFFVAWGKEALIGTLLPTSNNESPDKGVIWFIDEDEAEARYFHLQEELVGVSLLI
ncbi:hypothetical protein [Phosphitispora fastidiosa]|uniref:hypothetical protein n=1 Tax=Phosphitispora fastidiosa TaxID=2837202 RepID=UPI001E4459FA|nr:hypothetical protein [Phosphitispora fastidiosa]MBU7008784.1 hypothetical protein [Phosphitispora fastidiosa]